MASATGSWRISICCGSGARISAAGWRGAAGFIGWRMAIGAEAMSRFTGKVKKVTVEVAPLKPAAKAEAGAAQQQLADRKALAD